MPGLPVELVKSAAEFEFDQAEQRFEIDGFEEERGKRVGGQVVNVVLDLVQGHAGQKDHREATAVFLEMAQDFKAINARHFQVKQDDIDFVVFEVLQRCGAVGDFIHAIA